MASALKRRRRGPGLLSRQGGCAGVALLLVATALPHPRRLQAPELLDRWCAAAGRCPWIRSRDSPLAANGAFPLQLPVQGADVLGSWRRVATVLGHWPVWPFTAPERIVTAVLARIRSPRATRPTARGCCGLAALGGASAPGAGPLAPCPCGRRAAPLNGCAGPDRFPGCSRPRITGLANPSSALDPSPQGPDAAERRPVEAGPAPCLQAGCPLCGDPGRAFIGRWNPSPGALPSRLQRQRPRSLPGASRSPNGCSVDARRPSRCCCST